jgi:TonB family protein
MLDISGSFQVSPPGSKAPVDVYSSIYITQLQNYLVAWSFVSGSPSGQQELKNTQIAFASSNGEGAAQEKVARQTSDPLRVAVKSEEMKKSLVYKVNPKYPSEAMHQRVAGAVKLHVVVGVDGGVKQVEFISGPSIFGQSTLDAVRQWKYKPPTANGQPVEVDTTVEVVFSFVQ